MDTVDLYNNEVELTGIVLGELEFSHDVFGESFYSFTLQIPRLSDVADFIPVTISERLMSEYFLRKGDRIEVKGQFRSYNNYSGVGNKLVLTVFARDVELIDEGINVKNPNYIYLNGFICKEPIYRTTPFGREICDILLAVNRAYNKSDYIPCIAWGRNARYFGNLKTGDNIKIWGRVQSREYQKKLNELEILNKVAYEVSISKMEILEDMSKDYDL